MRPHLAFITKMFVSKYSYIENQGSDKLAEAWQIYLFHTVKP